MTVQQVADHFVATIVKPSHPEDATEWNRYLAARSSEGLFFRVEWNEPFSAYGLTVERLIAFREGKIVGILPFVWQKSLLFGSQLVSLPWFDTCGVLADDEEASGALVAEAVRLAEQRGAESVQLRHHEQLEISPQVRTDKVLMQLDLPAAAETLWKGFSAKVRNQVRKGQKAGLTVQSGGMELLDVFYRIYSENMRDLGSPSHHRRFFTEVLNAFPEEATVHVVSLDGEPVGAGLTLANGNHLEIPWASSLRRHNRLCVNHVMYAHILEGACHDGFSSFRFGRSTPDSGTYKFKKQWGAIPVQLYWYILPTGKDATVDIAPPQESYGWGTKVWQRLPVWLTRRLGPFIIAKVG